MLDRLEDHGFVDAHLRCSPGVQAHSWIGRSGNGYRFDYFHVCTNLADRIATCSYLHESREQGLTDHAAASLTLDQPAVPCLPIDPARLTGGLSVLDTASVIGSLPTTQ
jgi:exodeoxyribonuclease III